MDRFVRGARVGGSRVIESAKSISAERPLTLGEVVYVLVSVQNKNYPDVTKADLLRLVDRAWDAYAAASTNSGEGKHES